MKYTKPRAPGFWEIYPTGKRTVTKFAWFPTSMMINHRETVETVWWESYEADQFWHTGTEYMSPHWVDYERRSVGAP